MRKPRSVSIISPEIQEILKSPDKDQLIREAFADMHPFDMLTLCEGLHNKEIAECVKSLGFPQGIDLFEQFDDKRKRDIFECFSKEWMADVLEQMASDKRADFVKYLSKRKREDILPLVARAERNDIKKLIDYKEGTAGSILTTDYAFVSPNTTAKAAIEKLKLQAFDRETIYYVYVLDDQRKLLGFVSLKDLLIASSSKLVENIMQKNLVVAHVSDDKEEVAKKLSDYNFLAMPVLDEEQRMVGIVTVDDVVDVVVQETTEDIYKYGAAGEYVDYLKSSSWQMAKQRTMWLLILVTVGFGTGWIIRSFSGELQTIVALSFFIPLILGTGGNAGTQSSTVVIRGLATGNIQLKDVLQVIQKELGVGILIGSLVAAFASFGAMWIGKSPLIGITVGVSMVAAVILATTLGAFLPILFKRLKLDPALMSGPFITSIVDVVSLVVYFSVAHLIFF